MRKLISIMLFSAYLFIGAAVAALLWRGGAGWAAGSAALAGTTALLVAFHAFVAQALTRSALEREIEAVRQAHRLLVDAMEAVQCSVETVEKKVETGRDARDSLLDAEVRMLEDLVRRMGADLEEKLAGIATARPSADPEVRHRRRQSAALFETVRDALISNRVDLYLQPVVGLPQRKTAYYESYTRLRDDTGRVLMPAEYLAVAEPEGLVAAIDNLLLFRCVQIVRRMARQDRKIGIFCNVSPASLGDEVFFPQFLEFMADNRDLAGALVFEMGQAAFDARGPIEARNMAKLADLGFRFSIDKVQTLDLDFRDLQRSEVKFVKVAADLLIEQLAGETPIPTALKDIRQEDFADFTRRYGVELIAEKVETERQVVDILDLDLRLGQGHLFGEPRAIKEQVLAETDPPSDFIRATLQLQKRNAG
jgi:cyclic-di-GMP phosphodiesterase TipF (flagellum assembly factor)